MMMQQQNYSNHRCPSCGKELPSNQYPEINYLCSKCKNKAESTPEFGERKRDE